MSDPLDHRNATGISVTEEGMGTRPDTSSDKNVRLPEEGKPFDAPTGGAGDPGGGADPDFPIPGRGPQKG
ncbi:MAG: hypothetical protein K0U98_05140 [Deltaproteobacteria bacterium]|nr:hypothetical protein [Deltaproteobacteria bacterium]